jgi:hypothetical protein
MGFFSWKTMDTEKSIPNKYSDRDTFRITMTDDKNNRWLEKEYEGYGVFGGKDYYELLDEMNGGVGDRDEGIIKADPNGGSKNPDIIYPSLTEDGAYRGPRGPETCDNQGYFYDEDDDE